MKKKEWNDGLNHLDPDIVEKYVEQKEKLRHNSKKPKGVWLRFGAIAACFLMIVSTIIVVPMLREDDPGVITPPNDTTNNENPGNIRPLHWDDVSSLFGVKNNSGTAAEMYEKVFYEITTGVYSNYKSGRTISDDYVGEKIDSVVIKTGWYQSWNDEERDVYEVNADVYEINGVDSKVAVAIKYLEKTIADTTDDFYVYANLYSEAETVSAFLEMYNAETYMSVATNAYIKNFNKDGSTSSLYKINEDALREIKTIIMKQTSTTSYNKYTNADIQAIENIVEDCKQRLQLTIDMQSAGGIGVMYVLDNGYVCFTGFGKCFSLHYIGNSAAESIINTVIDNSESVSTNAEETINHSIG